MAEGNSSISSGSYGHDGSNSGREGLYQYNGQDHTYPQTGYITDTTSQTTYHSAPLPYQSTENQSTYQQVYVPQYAAGNMDYNHYSNRGPSQPDVTTHYDNSYQGYNMNVPTIIQAQEYHSSNSQVYNMSGNNSYQGQQNSQYDSQGTYNNTHDSTGETTYNNSQRYDTSNTRQQNSKESKTSANNSISENRARGRDGNLEKYVNKDETNNSDTVRGKNSARGNGRGGRGRGRGGRDNSSYGYYEEDRSRKNTEQENGQRQYEGERRRGGNRRDENTSQENGQRQYEGERRRGGNRRDENNEQENGQRQYEGERRRGGNRRDENTEQENGQRHYEGERRRGGNRRDENTEQENGQRQYEGERRRGGNRRDERNRGSRGGGRGGFEGNYRGNNGGYRGRGGSRYGDDNHQQKERGGRYGDDHHAQKERGGSYHNDYQHQRDNALATVTAMMSLRQGDSTNYEDMSGDKTSQQGPLNKSYRGRGRGDYRRREFEEKQGKDRRNRLTRIEDGVRPQSEPHTEDYNNIPERYNRNDKSYNRNKGNWRNNDRERSHEDVSSGKYSQPIVNNNTGYEPQPSPSKNRNQKNRNRLWNNPKDDLSVSTSKESDNSLDLSVNVEPKEEKRKGEDDESQRHRLVEQLMGGTYECMVCVDRIRQPHAIWSCTSCYNCFHLGCIKKWAKTSTADTGWRCPACQNTTPKVPNAYLCFCSKMREPEWNRRDTAHSCGEVCGRLRKIEWCTHKCTLLCHPGPCPPCTAYIKKSCACGAESRDVRCSQTEPFFCDGVCDKELNCGGHKCERPCHEEPCGDCEHMITQNCYCNKKTKEVICTSDTLGETMFSCENICELSLDCGNHKCTQVCHPKACEPCQRAVERMTRCPCDKVPLEKLYERDGAIQRRSCTDPIPTCSQPCQKQLKCGIPGSYHQCQAMCHEGPCPQCPSETPVKCRCGFMDKNIPCSELTTKADEVTCEKQCKKMRQCGRHKCAIKCCIDVDHICSLICNRSLKCGLHKCEESCHRGNCPRCWQTSFEELTCHCGASVTYPPVPCGTKPPSCDQPCRRPAACEHTASHHCHPEDACPPCTLLVDKPCFRGHKIMRSTPCYVPAVSCGAGCQAPLTCGIHVCQRVCHDGTCITNGKCPQKCSRPRESCGHPCANACHQGLCPETVCKEKLKISCICGLRKVAVQCSDNDREYKAMATNLLATQMQNMNNGLSVDLSHIFTATARPDKLKRLPCTEDCQTLDRNRRLAIALQIENPETREKLGNSSLIYSDFMKEEVRKDPVFAKQVHDALTDLVFKAKDSKQKSRSHSFAPMNRDKRQYIHEACEHFGCQSQSYDEEPKKNVVATATRGMCYLPPLSVLEVVQRDQGRKTVPGPVWASKGASASSSRADTYGSSSSGGMRKLEKSTSLEKETEIGAAKPAIDYFDFDS